MAKYRGEYLYHATSANNIKSIAKKGILMGCDSCVYLAETQEEALRFMMFRPVDDIVVYQVFVPQLDPEKLHESFDHSFAFFQCKAWFYDENIPRKALSSFTVVKKNDKESEPNDLSESDS